MFTDTTMLLFEKSIQCGITQAVKGCANANNRHMKEQHSANEANTYLQNLAQLAFTSWQKYKTCQ